MPSRRRRNRRASAGVGGVYRWKEYAIVYLTATETKYFNTTDFEKPNDRPWRLTHIELEVVSPQIGAVVQVDILNDTGLSDATSGPRAVGGVPVRLRVTNPNMIWSGAGNRPAYNLVAIKSLCTGSALQTVQLIGHLTLYLTMKAEILPTTCPTICRSQSELDLQTLE